MIRNYLKVALRSLRRNKGYTIINILGLAIGIAFSCMMYIYVSGELSSDAFHRKSDRIYRTIAVDNRVPDQPRTYGSVSPPLSQALLDDYPEVTEMVRVYQFSGQVVYQVDGENFQERSWLSTHGNFFEIFDFDFVAGDRNTALKEPFSVVLSESMADRLYGDKDPIGEVLENTNYGTLKVTGVVKDAPENSHIKFNMLLSEVQSGDSWNQYLANWQTFGAYSYIVLKEGTTIASLEAKLPEFHKKYFGPYAEVFGTKFQNIEDIYFNSQGIEFGIESKHGEMSYIYIFSTMGIFILLIACINYINLATSKAVYRSKEIGIRKVVGAFKKQLIAQFLTESFLVALLAMILAVGIMDLALPFFNDITGTSFDLNISTLQSYLIPLFIIATVIALFSGSYPAFYLSQLRPVSSLKGQEVGGRKSGAFRKGLVTFQFVLTIVMLVSTLLIGRQLNFIQEKDMGFNKDRLLVIDINSVNVRRQFQSMKNEFELIPGVESVGVSSRVPGEWKNIGEVYAKSKFSDKEEIDSVRTYFMGFDEGMLETFRFEMSKGNYFSNNGGDSTQILINESAAEALGLEEPVGARVKVLGVNGSSLLNATVAGVITDFNFQSLHNKIAPIIIGAWNNPIRSIDYFTLKVSGDMQQVIAASTLVHEKFDSNTPMEYHFLDEQLKIFYEAEKRAGMIFRMAAGLCIFVACLGLLGLASFMVEKRKKELGIRKILGANEMGLFVLLSSSISKQIGLAFVIATPVAWYIMNNWLEAFEYRVSIGVGTFIIAGLVAFSIALLTISYRAMKAIYSNPVESLRQD